MSGLFLQAVLKGFDGNTTDVQNGVENAAAGECAFKPLIYDMLFKRNKAQSFN